MARHQLTRSNHRAWHPPRIGYLRHNVRHLVVHIAVQVVGHAVGHVVGYGMWHGMRHGVSEVGVMGLW